MDLLSLSKHGNQIRQTPEEIAAIAEILKGSWRATWLEWHKTNGGMHCFLCSWITGPVRDYHLTDLETMVTYRSDLQGIDDRKYVVAIQTLHCERQLSWVAPSKTSLVTS